MRTIFITALLAAAVTMQAQQVTGEYPNKTISYTGNGIMLRSSDSGISMDFSKSNPLEGAELQIHEGSAGGPVIVDVGQELNNITKQIYDDGVRDTTFKISQGYFDSKVVCNPSFAITVGQNQTYTVTYKIPTTVKYRMYCHNNYSCFSIKLLAIHSNGEIMGRCTLAQIEVNRTLEGTYYQCVGTGESGFIDTEVKFDNIYPTGSREFEDLYWEEFDKDPTSSDVNNHDSYYKEIDHFMVTFDFYE